MQTKEKGRTVNTLIKNSLYMEKVKYPTSTDFSYLPKKKYSYYFTFSSSCNRIKIRRMNKRYVNPPVKVHQKSYFRLTAILFKRSFNMDVSASTVILPISSSF